MRRLKEERTEILRNERLWGRDIKRRRRFNSILNMLRGGMPTPLKREREGGGEAGGGEAGGGEAGGGERGSKRQRVQTQYEFLKNLFRNDDRDLNETQVRQEARMFSISFDRKKVKEEDIKNDRVRTLESHSAAVTSVSFSPDGQWIASGSEDETVKVWSVESGEFKTLDNAWEEDDDDHVVTSVSFSPDGQWIASGSEDNTVKVWSVESGRLHKILRDHSEEVLSVSFSPDGRKIVSGSGGLGDNTVKVWSVDEWGLEKTLEGHSDFVSSVSFSPDGQWIASGSEDKTVKVWSVETGRLQKTMYHSDFVSSVSFSPDGQLIASGSNDKTVKVWSVESGGLEKTFEGHFSEVNSVSFSPDGAYIVSGSDDTIVKVWSVESGECVANLGLTDELDDWADSDYVRSVSFSLDGRKIVSGSSDETVKVWDVSFLEEVKPKESNEEIFYDQWFRWKKLESNYPLFPEKEEKNEEGETIIIPRSIDNKIQFMGATEISKNNWEVRYVVFAPYVEIVFKVGYYGLGSVYINELKIINLIYEEDKKEVKEDEESEKKVEPPTEDDYFHVQLNDVEEIYVRADGTVWRESNDGEIIQVKMERFTLYIDDPLMTNYEGDITKRFGHIIRKFEEQGTLANLTIEVERQIEKDGKLEFYPAATVTWLPVSTRAIQPRFPEVIYYVFESISEYFFELFLERPISPPKRRA